MKRITGIILALVMLIGAGTAAPSADTVGKDLDDDYFKGAFCYRPSREEFSSDGDSIDSYAYSDSFFCHPAFEYDDHLASMSLAVAAASSSSSREPCTPEGYADKSRNVRAILDDIGLCDIAVNDDYRRKPTKDSVGVVCGHKSIIHDGVTCTLLAVIPRSASYEAEWGNNFVLGSQGDAEGFDAASNKVLSFIRGYIREYKLSGRIKVWTAGYSRGAAISDLISKKLIDAPRDYLGGSVTLAPADLYAYTFGTPSAAVLDNSPHSDMYRGIFNLYSDCEFVSLLAPSEMDFARYGTDIAVNRAEDRDRMLELLEICSKSEYELYSSGGSPADFKPKKLSFSDGSVQIVDDPDPYIPTDAAEYLRGLSEYMTRLTGGRQGYVNGYEQLLSDLLAFTESLTGDDRTAFLSSLTGHSDTVSAVLSMYAYFMKLKASAQSDYSSDVLAGTSAAAGAPTGLGAADVAKLTVLTIAYMNMDAESIRDAAAGYLSNIITDAMRAGGADDEQIAAIIDDSSMRALAYMISHLLFGNIWQSDEVRPVLINNEQMKSAATLVGNLMVLIIDHHSEELISWVRTGDSYFDDYAPLTAAQAAGYRRVYIRIDGDPAYTADIYNADGEKAASVRSGMISDCQDRWIGFTSTDDGGFLRLPAGGSYRAVIHTDTACTVTASVDEYSVYDARAIRTFSKTVSADGLASVILTLPELDDGYTMPSSAQYSCDLYRLDEAYILGDCDGDGAVTIFDATCIQRFLAGLPNKVFHGFAADADEDGTVSITDATAVQRMLAAMPSNGHIGRLRFPVPS